VAPRNPVLVLDVPGFRAKSVTLVTTLLVRRFSSAVAQARSCKNQQQIIARLLEIIAQHRGRYRDTRKAPVSLISHGGQAALLNRVLDPGGLERFHLDRN
jgi:hypothetical protein